jgi:hypothetical protein
MPETKDTTMFSLARVKAYLNAVQSDKDQIIVDVADGVSDRIEALTGRKIVTRSITELSDARGCDHLALRDFPITEVTSVQVRMDLRSDWQTLDAADYEADTRLGVVYLKSGCFYAGPMTTQVVYAAGYGAQDAPTLPLFQPALDWVKFAFTRQGNNLLVVSSMSDGGRTSVIVPEPPKDILNAVMALRKIRVGL